MIKSRKITVSAMCIALCYILPIAFHSIGLGSMLSPMHIPVLLCGLVCGGWAGFLCGLIGPILSCLLSGMPAFLALFRMIPELCAYGVISGLMMKTPAKNHIVKVYISLIGAMVMGRIVGGIASAAFYTVTSGFYSLPLWFSAYFAECVPAIFVHIALIPALYFSLRRAGLTQPNYN